MNEKENNEYNIEFKSTAGIVHLYREGEKLRCPFSFTIDYCGSWCPHSEFFYDVKPSVYPASLFPYEAMLTCGGSVKIYKIKKPQL